MLCGDFNARGELWGNTVTNPQGESLEDALNRSDLTCINDGSITRIATRPGDSDSIIDLAITTLLIYNRCTFHVLGPQGNDHLLCSVLVRRSKMTHQPKRTRAFIYSKEGDDPLTKLRAKKAPGDHNPGQRQEQPPWFTKVVEALWGHKREACKPLQRHRKDRQAAERRCQTGV